MLGLIHLDDLVQVHNKILHVKHLLSTENIRKKNLIYQIITTRTAPKLAETTIGKKTYINAVHCLISYHLTPTLYSPIPTETFKLTLPGGRPQSVGYPSWKSE